MRNEYDVIIAGGSFAGLAVASRLRGRVLFIDKHGIGEGQTSACGTLLDVLRRLGLMESVLQVQGALVFHLRDRTEIMETRDYPFCTFDYARFCQKFAARLEVEILRAGAQRLEGDRVVTDRGAFAASCIVDASGWRAVLARSLRPDYGETKTTWLWVSGGPRRPKITRWPPAWMPPASPSSATARNAPSCSGTTRVLGSGIAAPTS